MPAAKWFTLDVVGDFVAIKAYASPVIPGSTLRHHLWNQVRGAVLTSATLTSGGQFDFFLRESGLYNDQAVSTLEVASPFNYAEQGTLVVTETQADPRTPQQFASEMVDALLEDLAQVQSGGLVLFTSREQMRLAVDALPTAMRQHVLVQTLCLAANCCTSTASVWRPACPPSSLACKALAKGWTCPARCANHCLSPSCLLPHPMIRWTKPVPNG